MIKIFVSVSLLIFIFSSCKTPQSAIKTSVTTPPVKTNNPFVDSMNLHRQRFDWFSAKAKIHMTEEKNETEFTANIRIRQDSAIWISISPALGIEVARVLITADSIRAIDRIHKDYYSKGYDFFNRYTSLSLDLKTLQDLIEGNPLFTMGKFYNTEEADSLVLLVWGQDSSKNTILLNKRFQHLTQNIIDGAKGSVILTNDQFDASYIPPFPMWRKIELVQPHQAKIIVTFSKVKINDPQKLPFNAGKE